MTSLATPETTAARFVAWTKQAIAKEMPVVALIAAAERLTAEGEPQLVQQLYKVWIDNNGEDPLLHAVNFNYGVCLSGAGDVGRAREAFTESIRINPDFLPPYINLGTLLERAGNLDQALQQWMRLVNRLGGVNGDTVQHKAIALKQLGRVLEGIGESSTAEDMLQRSLDLNPHQRDVIQHWVSLRMAQCKWPVVKPWGAVTRKMLMEAISPLSLAAYSDDPVLQLANAHHYCRLEIASPGEAHAAPRWSAADAGRRRRLRIGYLSSDLREHAVGFLTSEIFELHDREAVEVFAYYCGPVSADRTQARIKAAVEHWRDITSLGDEEAARLIRDDRIDILVDLNGYTKDARTKVFARRPAPIIVNWLGYPGTTGSPHHDYIVADEFIIPTGSEKYYSEKVLRLPCYQPNDRRRTIAPHRPSRAEAGLPEDGFVFCCFNGVQKITTHTFRRWMTILAGVPGSVLWLLSTNAAVDERLRQEAAQLGVAPERIVFAPKRGNADHLARYPLADLFLDTAPYGAHTTASDAMWMGVPVLTAPGRGFASRVCGSLVRAAGLGELVCDSLDRYVAAAIDIARDPGRLERLRETLRAGKESCVLFDTPLLVAKLEERYREMWQAHGQRAVPLPDLGNLALYQEIGGDLDHEATEFQADPGYERRYVAALEKRHRISPIRPDPRLWTAEQIAAADAPIDP